MPVCLFLINVKTAKTTRLKFDVATLTRPQGSFMKVGLKNNPKKVTSQGRTFGCPNCKLKSFARGKGRHLLINSSRNILIKLKHNDFLKRNI